MFDQIINKNNILKRDYVPSDLIITDNNENNFHNYKDPLLKPMISHDILTDFLMMQNDALKYGFHIIVDSGYRSYDYQKKIWDQSILTKGYFHTVKYIAPPGASEHQSGLAIDIAYFRNLEYIDNITGEEPEIKWLVNNSYKYGFILRYPKDKEAITGINYEPWHFRYVGKELAHILYTNNLTLEEYHMNKTFVNRTI